MNQNLRRLKDYQPFLSALLRILVEDVETIEFQAWDPLEEVLRHRRMVVALSHSTPISWLPAISLLGERTHFAGGGDRIPCAVMDHLFFSMPLLDRVAAYFTQSERPLRFEELLSNLSSSEEPRDLVIFPEGSMTFFGDLREIQPFRSPRFVELAIRARAPILVGVHHGTEEWNRPVTIPREIVPYLGAVSSLFGRRIAEEPFLNLPLNLKRISRFQMITKLYTPTLKESDLSEDSHERKMQIVDEAEKVRHLMQNLLDELQEPKQKKSSGNKTKQGNKKQ